MSDAFGVGAHAAAPILSTVQTTVFQIRSEYNVRCTGTRSAGPRSGQPCGALLGEKLTRPWTLACWRCGLRTEKE